MRCDGYRKVKFKFFSKYTSKECLLKLKQENTK